MFISCLFFSISQTVELYGELASKFISPKECLGPAYGRNQVSLSRIQSIHILSLHSHLIRSNPSCQNIVNMTRYSFLPSLLLFDAFTSLLPRPLRRLPLPHSPVSTLSTLTVFHPLTFLLLAFLLLAFPLLSFPFLSFPLLSLTLLTFLLHYNRFPFSILNFSLLFSPCLLSSPFLASSLSLRLKSV